MQLVINTYGSYLRKKGNCFLVRKEDKVFEVFMNKVDSILITTTAYISTDAIKFAVDNNVDIVFLDSYDDPYGRVWHPNHLVKEVKLSDTDFERAISMVGAVLDIIQKGFYPDATKYKARCVDCTYWYICV